MQASSNKDNSHKVGGGGEPNGVIPEAGAGTPCGSGKHCRFCVILGPLSNRGRSSIWTISILMYVSAHFPLQKVFRVVSAPSTLNDTIMEYLGHHGKSGSCENNHKKRLKEDIFIFWQYILVR